MHIALIIIRNNTWKIAMKLVSVLSLAALGLTSIAQAQETTTDEAQAPAAEKGFWEQDKMTGDWGGLRSDLSDKGIELGLTYSVENLKNVTGGKKRMNVVDGLFQTDLDVDTEKLIGWQGGKLHSTALFIHGQQLTTSAIGGLIPVSSLEADPSTRLFSLWYEQSVADNRASLRVGQIPMQEEFYTSVYAAYLVNSAFGWPAIYALNMPSGGGGYPIANLGSRLKVNPIPEISAMLGVFASDVAYGKGNTDPQRRNSSGTNFRITQAPVWFGETSYAMNQDKDAAGLPATYKLGGWYYNGNGTDQRYDTNGISLGSASTNGNARNLHGNWAIYGIMDRMLWRREGTTDSGVGSFLRTTYMPDDRNQMSFWLDAGLTLKGTIEGRDDDVAALGFAYGKMSDTLASMDKDAQTAGTSTNPVHDFEGAVELMYTYQITPWMSTTPVYQHLFHPGGNVTLPGHANTSIPDADLVGARLALKF